MSPKNRSMLGVSTSRSTQAHERDDSGARCDYQRDWKIDSNAKVHKVRLDNFTRRRHEAVAISMLTTPCTDKRHICSRDASVAPLRTPSNLQTAMHEPA